MYRRPLNSLQLRSASRRPLRNRLGFEVLEGRQMLSATLWVDPNVTPTASIFSNIQAAVDAAKNGDTIKVVAHTYTAGADVNKSVTIIGVQVRVSGEPEGSSIIANPGSLGFDLIASGVTIKNFILTGEDVGINTLSSASGFNVLNNTFIDNDTGVHLNTSLASSAKTSTISGNTFFYDGTGSAPTNDILTDVGARNVTISNNLFEARDTDAAIKVEGSSQSANVQILNNHWVEDNDAGIVVANATTSKINGNTMDNPLDSTAILLPGGFTKSQVENNVLGDDVAPIQQGIWLNNSVTLTSDINDTISGNTIGGFSTAIELQTADNNTISDNAVLDSVNDGITVADSDSTFNTISSNSIARNGENGISVFATSDHNTVSGNMVSNNAGYGIQVASNDNTISKNSFNSNTRSGVFLDGSTGNTLTGNTMSENGDAGIVTVGATMNTLSGNTCNFNATDGIALESDSNQNKFSSNTANFNNEVGIALSNSSTNMMLSNKANQNISTGFDLQPGDTGNTLTGNTASNNVFGFDDESNTDNTYTKNIANGNLSDGFYIFSGSGHILTSNIAESNEDNGIYIDGDSMCSVKNNTTNNNGQDGLLVDTADNNTVTGNTSDNNVLDGIAIIKISTGNIVSGNKVSNNQGDGISVSDLSSSNTISGNTVSGSGNFDLYDGSGTTTNNTWSNNKATTRDPFGLL